MFWVEKSDIYFCVPGTPPPPSVPLTQGGWVPAGRLPLLAEKEAGPEIYGSKVLGVFIFPTMRIESLCSADWMPGKYILGGKPVS